LARYLVIYPMKITFHNEFGQVWTDDVSPYIFTLITQVPPSSALAIHYFKAHLDLIQSLRKKFKEAYLISDFSQATNETRDLVCHYYIEFLPKLIKAKISYIAFICPNDTLEQLPKEKQELLEKAPLGVFPTFVDALADINRKRSQNLAKAYKKAIG
jgi:hypothetical protein